MNCTQFDTINTVHILGAGAIGLLYAAYLSKIVPTTLISRPHTETNKHSKRRKITLIKPDGKIEPIILNVAVAPQEALDYILVCTKSYDAEAALEQINAYLKPGIKIVLLQNGMGFQKKIADKYPSCEVIIASTTEGANKPGTDSLIHAAKGMTTLGYINNLRSNHSLAPLADLLQTAGFNCTIETNIKEILWRKLIINCGINPFTAVLNCPNGEILSSELFKDRIDKLTIELSKIASLEGINASPEQCKVLITSVATSTNSNISSMLQDIRNNRKTEIEFMNGYIVLMAKKYNISCPINQELTVRVKALA